MLSDYENLKEGSFDYNACLDESVMICVDYLINEELEAENELINSDHIITLVDIVDGNLFKEDI